MGETSKRIASAAALMVFYLFMIFYADFYYLQTYLILLLGGIVGIREFYNLSDRGEDGKPFRGTGIFLCSSFLHSITSVLSDLKINSKPLCSFRNISSILFLLSIRFRSRFFFCLS